MLKCNYGENYSPWTPWENASHKRACRLMPLLNEGKEQPALSIGSPSLRTLPMQLLGPPSCHPQASNCYFPEVLHEKNKEKEGEREEPRTSFQLCSLRPVAYPLPGQADERWEDEPVGQTRDSLVLWEEMGRLQTADSEKGELLQVRKLTGTHDHCLTARRWQLWEEAPASGTQKIQQEFTVYTVWKENPGRKVIQAHSPADSGTEAEWAWSIKMWVAMSPLYCIKTSRLPVELSLLPEGKRSVFSIVFALHNSVIFWCFCLCHLLTYTNWAKQWVSLWHFHTCLWCVLPICPSSFCFLSPWPLIFFNFQNCPLLLTCCVHACLCVCVCAHENTWGFHLNVCAPVSLCIWHECVCVPVSLCIFISFLGSYLPCFLIESLSLARSYEQTRPAGQQAQGIACVCTTMVSFLRECWRSKLVLVFVQRALFQLCDLSSPSYLCFTEHRRWPMPSLSCK